MKKTCDTYMPEELSRFVDNELSQNLQQAVEKHLIHCSCCRRMVEQYRSVGAVFSHHADQERLKINPAKLTHRLESPLQVSKKRAFGILFGPLGNRIYLKLASIAAILMISLFTFQGDFRRPAAPSAIVQSVDTEFASVMIIETPRKKHTIIWFSETGYEKRHHGQI